MSAPGRPKRESSPGEEVAQRQEGTPLSINAFVYGTLRSGEINDLAAAAARAGLPAPRLLGLARVPGRLVDFGDWPGLLPGGPGTVRGELYAIDPSLVPLMDAIEEYTPGAPCCFVRRPVRAQTDAGPVDCQYYPIDPDFRGAAPDIDGDDWVLYRLQRPRRG